MATGNEMISRNIIFKVHCQTLELETWIELLSLYELTRKRQKTAYLAEMGNRQSQMILRHLNYKKGCPSDFVVHHMMRDLLFCPDKI